MFSEELLFSQLRNSFCKLTKNEVLFLERVIFIRVLDELANKFNTRYASFQKLLRNELGQEDEEMGTSFLRDMVADIVSTNEYTLEGIANVIRVPVDAIVEIVTGINKNPSFVLVTKIIKLHADIRREFYTLVIDKLIHEKSVAVYQS